jgi:hypothetical protein
LGENSHEEEQAVEMGKLSDMDEEFDGRSSGMRKGVKTLVINKGYIQLEILLQMLFASSGTTRYSYTHAQYSGRNFEREAFLQISEHYIFQIMCKTNYILDMPLKINIKFN